MSTGAARSGVNGYRCRRLLAGILLLSVFPMAWGAERWIVADEFPVCFYRAVTHRPCAFCGLTRAFAAVSHGRWVDACRFNWLWIVMVPGVILVAVLCLADAADGRDRVQAALAAVHRLWMPILLAIVAMTIVRGFAGE